MDPCVLMTLGAGGSDSCMRAAGEPKTPEGILGTRGLLL